MRRTHWINLLIFLGSVLLGHVLVSVIWPWIAFDVPAIRNLLTLDSPGRQAAFIDLYVIRGMHLHTGSVFAGIGALAIKGPPQIRRIILTMPLWVPSLYMFLYLVGTIAF